MKRFGSLRKKDRAWQNYNLPAEDDPQSILGNKSVKKQTFNLTKSISQFLKKPKDRDTLQVPGRLREDRSPSIASLVDCDTSGIRKKSDEESPYPGTKIRRNSSELSLSRGRKKLLTLEELYVEVLYTVLHMIGCDVDHCDQDELIEHIKDAFNMENDKHVQLLDIATMKEEPYLKLNLEIGEGRDFLGKDISGNSDPFCTFYLSTNPLARFNTSYKPKTLNPVWNEEFILDVNSTENDVLNIDIWDFNPEERVKEKLKKINEVKDARGLRKFIKETLNASAGKHSHDLLGSVRIPLKQLPASGVDEWFPLEKAEAKTKRRGELKVQMILSTEKDQSLTSQEHRHLLQILFAYELKLFNSKPYTWNGTFSKESLMILAQHAVQGKLTGADTSLARWMVYCHTHCDLPLDYKVFIPILEKLSYAINNEMLTSDDEKRFFDVCESFIQCSAIYLRKHRHYLTQGNPHSEQFVHILQCLYIIETLQKDRFGSSNLIRQIEMVISKSSKDWYKLVMQKLQNEDGNKEISLKFLTNLTQILSEDLSEGCSEFQKLFDSSIQINYTKIYFLEYSAELQGLLKPHIEEACNKLKPVIFSENEAESVYINNDIVIGTNLFELYLAIKQFLKLSESFSLEEKNEESLFSYHKWFYNAVTRWLDIALFKAMERIKRSVELDELQAVDPFIKNSTSAIDFRTIFIQIKTFWKQLNWPDIEASYAFISKILDDICKSAIFYSDKICDRVFQNNNRDPNGRFEVTIELCLALNNIDCILDYLRPFIDELGMEEVVLALEAENGKEVADSCRKTLKTLVLNALENVENKILQVLDELGEQMAPNIQKFLLHGSSFIGHYNNENTLIKYLDHQLVIMKDNLNQTNFERVLTVIWDSSAQIIENTIYESVEKKKPAYYFQTLYDTLNILINFLYGDEVPKYETLLKLKKSLMLYSSETNELFSRYYWERLKEQRMVQGNGEYSYGSITFRVQLLQQHLRIEILNARHLKPLEHSRSSRNYASTKAYLTSSRMRSMQNVCKSQTGLEWVKSRFSSLKSNLHDAGVQVHCATSNGNCDPYVTVRLVPKLKFPNCFKKKSKVQRRTLFPLFDEIFDFVLPMDSNFRQDSYILFTLKDQAIFPGHGWFLGEAILPFSEIYRSSQNTLLKDLPQIQLPLTKPNLYDSDIMFALSSRNFDKPAKDFFNKEKKKL